MPQLELEYGEDCNDLDGLIPPSTGQKTSLALEHEHESSNTKRSNAFSFCIATIQAFVIIYRTEVLLGAVLTCSVGVAISSYYRHHNRKLDPFKAAHIKHDYSDVHSKYDLSLGAIDHWCLRGDDNSCRCEDPLEPMGKSSSLKWRNQHHENIKVATEALMKLTSPNGGSASWGTSVNQFGDDYDWMEYEDDWVYGAGPRFEDDYTALSATGSNPHLTGNQHDWNDNGHEGLAQELDYELDVVFLGDSITEQRQGTRLGREVGEYAGIKEVFERTFTKAKGGDFNGIAMGIAGDTAPNLLWRLRNGEMPYGLKPKVWWVGVGINDLSITSCSEEVVFLGILRIVEEIQNSLPETTIVINSLLPVRRNEEGLLEHAGKHHEHEALKKKENNLSLSEMDSKRLQEDLWPSIVSINEELRKFASRNHGIKFFDADGIFVEERENGKYIKLELMHDAVHPNLKGHKKWNNAIEKRLSEIIKEH